MRTFFRTSDSDSAEPKQTPVAALEGRRMITNLERTMARAPALLEGYLQLSQQLAMTSLAPVEQQIVCLCASLENECEYCAAWHSMLAASAGLSPPDLAALRTGAALSTPRLEALRRFTVEMMHTRGAVGDESLAMFLAAGWSPSQALEIVLAVGLKTLSNYAARLTGVTLDPLVERQSSR